MKNSRERILLVESNPEISDLIARQTLQAMGYQVEVIRSAATAIQEASRFLPDLIIADLQLQGLSGKDLLVALASQGLEIPVIVIAQKGMEGDVIQTFRLGASDYLLWPMREAEIVSAVERLLKQTRARKEREALERQLKQTNQELQRRVRELTTIFAIGKAVISITDQRKLLEKIVEGAIYVSEADSGWLLLRTDKTRNYVLSAERNLPKEAAARLNQPWEDGISSLVALSGEPLSIHGEPLERFKVARIGKAALVMPIKIKKEVIGLLVVVRKEAKPFTSSDQTLLEAVSDYASISLVNSRLFKALEERARALQYAAETAKASEYKKDEIIRNFRQELGPPLEEAIKSVDGLLFGENERLNATQKGVLRSIQENMHRISETVDSFSL